MTSIIPVSVYKAYDILRILPKYAAREDIIKSILSTGISMSTATLYFRALKNWGFIRGSEYLEVHKPKLEDFLADIRKQVVNELGSKVIDIINNAYSSTGNINIKTLAYHLRRRGIKISEWKLRVAIRLLTSTNYLTWERKIRVIKFSTDLKSIVLREILTRGACQLDTFISAISNKLRISPIKVKSILSELIDEEKIHIDCPHTLLDLWQTLIQDGHYENIEIDVSSPRMLELVESYPDLFEKKANKVFMKSVMDGKFTMYPVITDQKK